jgi:glucuronoarabinoxylan endo-1,4-beta-xylanase
MTKSIVLLGIACSGWCQSSPPPGLEEQPARFSVHPEITHQTIAGFGAGSFEGRVIAQLKNSDRERLYDLLYTEQGVKLNIIRMVIPEAAEPLPANHELRRKGIIYNWPATKEAQAIFGDLKPIFARVKPILYFVPFSPPARWKSSRRLNWGGLLLREHYQDYAGYLADFIKYCERVKGIKVDILSLQNEPDVAAPWSSCRWTEEELRAFLQIAGPVFQREGLTTRIMAPEGSSWDQTAMKAAPLLEDPAGRYIGIVASHSYGWDDIVDRGRDVVRSLADRRGVPVWMSEMSTMGPPDDASMGTALKVARYMYRDLVEADASAWIYCFTIFIPEFQGSMGLLSPIGNGELRIPKRFWAFANFSRFVQPGWKRISIDGLGFANAGFVSPAQDRFTIVALNASFHPRPATYEFGNWRVSSVDVFRTSKDEDLRSVGAAHTGPNGFSATLAPISVTTFSGKLTGVSKGS